MNTFIQLPRAGGGSGGTITGPIDVNISSNNDSIKISDGVDTLAVNPDGSLNIAGSISGNVSAVSTGVNEFAFNELIIAAGATTTLISQTFPSEYKLRRVRGSGETIAVYSIRFNAAGVDKLRSTYTDFNATFDFETGITIPAGTTVNIDVTNAGSAPAQFSAQILYSAV